jgi:hypothetical protein
VLGLCEQFLVARAGLSVKHLNPRQGITTFSSMGPPQLSLRRCETPKSPPGDYNSSSVNRICSSLTSVVLCVKHLNPRQGITTDRPSAAATDARGLRVKHLNPRQGITTRPHSAVNPRTDTTSLCARVRLCVKHLNPRQGITTYFEAPRRRTLKHLNPRINLDAKIVGVKHLNPRQGITTLRRREQQRARCIGRKCETPKSPPGDYNLDNSIETITPSINIRCETPKSPPGDYNHATRKPSLRPNT